MSAYIFGSADRAMDRTRYRISLESNSKNSQVIYRAPNPAQGFDALFTRHAISIRPRQPADKTEQRPSWQTALSLIGYGYKNDFVILSAHELEALDNRIELRHESVDGTGRSVTEWYVNRAEGLEQGFVIHAQPSGKLEGEKLRVAMKLSGDLKAETTTGDGQAISFSTPTGAEALRYEKLFVTDAAGRKLAAQMRVEAGENAGAAYVFGRNGATWTQQAKLTPNDGHPFQGFSISVAISGQTVVIGAQNDITLGTQAGATYIFIDDSPPTAVGLSSFTASAYDDGISLEWSTGFEVSNLGFNLYRDEGGKRTTINSSLIAGSALLVSSGTRLSAGRSYTWWDNAPADLKKSSYWVEAVDLDGSTQWFGPVTVKFVGGHAPDRSQAALLARRGYLQSGITAPLTRSAIPHPATQFKQTIEADPALLPAIKIAVKTEGWYRITQPELVRAGIDPKIDPRYLQLFVDGRQLPISVTGEQDGILDADDMIEFYAVGLDTASTDARVYWLARGPQFGFRIATVESRGVPYGSVSFPYTVERRDRTIYFSSLLNGERENFFGPVITSVPLDQCSSYATSPPHRLNKLRLKCRFKA
jgi:hypothetical protein